MPQDLSTVLELCHRVGQKFCGAGEKGEHGERLTTESSQVLAAMLASCGSETSHEDVDFTLTASDKRDTAKTCGPVDVGMKRTAAFGIALKHDGISVPSTSIPFRLCQLASRKSFPRDLVALQTRGVQSQFVPAPNEKDVRGTRS